jgi:predicted phosphoribosyltransferase
MRFRDRTAAGRLLAEPLRQLDLADPVVLALPRGGVPVAHEIASALNAPLDVFVARKIGAPGHPEFGIGAIAETDAVVADREMILGLGLSAVDWNRLVFGERSEVERRVKKYRGDRPMPDVRGRDVILVDDGLATGVTAEAAVHAIRSLEPRRLIVAVPVCSAEAAKRLARLADDVVCLAAPERFRAVGQWYEYFDQTTDDEVLDLLERALTTTKR